jgi:SAM-dependent methyltransferase
MTSFPFDRSLQRRHLARARLSGYADFLTRWMAQDLRERLNVISRSFPLVVDWGTPDMSASTVLQASGKAEHILRCAPGLPDSEASLIIDMECVPFGEHGIDAIVSLFALHHINDLPGTLIQLRRSLKPDGLFLAGFLGGATLNELRSSFLQAESELTGGVTPRVAPFTDLRYAGALMQRAGFALPVVDTEILIVRYAHPLGLMQDLRLMGLANSLNARSRHPLSRRLLHRVIEIYTQNFSDADGRIRATFEAVWLLGWSPHESQQKPLRPGSAKTRLADALGVKEGSAGEKAER